MLEAIRSRSNSLISKIIIGLIIVPFAFAGVYSYFGPSTSNAVATVNGEEISSVDFERSYRFQQQNWGENFDRYFNTDERLQQFRLSVLQQLINQRLSTQAINEMGLRTSDQRLRDVIMGINEFNDENGNFDVARYEISLQARGYSANQYQNARKNDMASNQFIQALQDSNFVLENEINLNKLLENQTRDVDYLIIAQDYYAKQVELTGEEGESAISSYYEMNKSRFAIPEKVSIEYLYINKRDTADVVISDGQISDYYNDNTSNFETSERRHLAHILVNVDEDAEQDVVDAAEQKINNFAARIQAGETFESIAIEGSEDTSTAEMGGDLDWIEKGMMDEAFEQAAFDLAEINSVSTVVRSNFGFHLIKLLAREGGGTQSLEDVKAQITETLKNRFVEDKFFDLKEKISERVFEVSDSLTEVAKTSGLLVRKSKLFDQQFGIGLPAELQEQPAVLEKAFSDDVLYQGLNSELIELSDGSAVVLRLLEHQEAGLSPLSEVRAQVVSLLTNERAREATERAGNQILAALDEGKTAEESLAAVAEPLPATWQQQLALGRQGTEINVQLRDEIFRIPAPKTEQSVNKGILLSSGDYAVVSLTAVNPGEVVVAEDADKQLDKMFMEYHSQVELFNYLKYLDAKASISRSVANTALIQ